MIEQKFEDVFEGRGVINLSIEQDDRIKLGDELRTLVANKEREWARIPESYRLGIKQEDMAEFAKGWDGYQVETLTNILREYASKGIKSHTIGFYGHFHNKMLTYEQRGKVARITHFLLNNNIRFSTEWSDSAVSGYRSQYTITITWSE